MSSYWLKYGNNVLNRNGAAVGKVDSPVDPYNPLNLPAKTMRLKYGEWVTTPSTEVPNATFTLVDSTENIWDLYYDDTDWTQVPAYSSGHGIIEVLGANFTGVTGASGLFSRCYSLESVTNIFDTSHITDMSSMFRNCIALTTIPLLPTDSCTNAESMFELARNVQTGALAIYTQMSTQANPPTSHDYTFFDCGSQTVTGAAELAQIPTSWGGTMQ